MTQPKTIEGVCEACGRKLSKTDYYRLCKKCQPAYKLGYEEGRRSILQAITDMLKFVEQ